jgi:hypothetical protein
MLPASTERVSGHTDQAVNERIEQGIRAETQSAVAEGPAGIDRRLSALEHQWDIERAIEANASSLLLLGLALGVFVNRRWLLLPAAVAAFLLQHALQGWCPPVPILRRLGFRTQSEIERERFALKALRGDFAEVDAGSPGTDAARTALEAARR